MDNNIIPKSDSEMPDETWSDLVGELLDTLKPGDLPNKVVRATEYLMAGWPIHKIAHYLHVDSNSVRRWISEYPTVAAALAKFEAKMTAWRLSRLEQQFLLALERNEEILSVGLDGTYRTLNGDIKEVDPRVMAGVAAQVRYTLGLMVGNHIDVTVTHEVGETVLNARKDALDYISAQLRAGENEPVEATFRVIDTKRDTSGPLLTEKGEAPFGAMGQLDSNDDGTQCHACGKRYKGAGLRNHVYNAHGLTPTEYELTYMLEDGTVKGIDKDE